MDCSSRLNMHAVGIGDNGGRFSLSCTWNLLLCNQNDRLSSFNDYKSYHEIKSEFISLSIQLFMLLALFFNVST